MTRPKRHARSLAAFAALVAVAAIAAAGCGGSPRVTLGDGGSLRPGEPSRLDSEIAGTRIEAQGYGGGWGTLCAAPCRPRLGPDQRYRVVVPGRAPVELTVSDERPLDMLFVGQDATEAVGGGVLIAAGGVAVFTGYIALLVQLVAGDEPYTGLALMGGGALGIVGGGSLVSSSRAELRIEKGATGWQHGAAGPGDADRRISLGGGLELSARGLHF